MRGYINIIEDVTNRSILVLQFLEESKSNIDAINETRKLLQKPQKRLNLTLRKLEYKLVMKDELIDLKDVTTHLDYPVTNLYAEENNLWKKIKRFRGVEKEYFNRDENTMEFYFFVVAVLFYVVRQEN